MKLKSTIGFILIGGFILNSYYSAADKPIKTTDQPVARKVKDVVIYKDAQFYSCFPSAVNAKNGELLVAFRRAPDRTIFGEPGSDHVDPNSYLMMVRSKDGENWTKEPELIYAQPTAHLHRYSLRLDGFVSLSAPYKGDEALTKPFTFSGHELEINYSTSAAGEIRFEIQNEKGQPVSGFTLEDSQPVIGNEISRIVQWKRQTSLKELAGKPVRLRICMKDADIYSIRFK
jgi:hypothetical protein